MIKSLSACLIYVLLTAVTAHAAKTDLVDRPIRLEDFAYGMALDFSGQEALYQVELPLAIYQNTTRYDLGDIRVFNAQGEMVPHMLRQQLTHASQPVLQALVYFPLQSASKESLDQLTVKIKTRHGTLLDIASTQPVSLEHLSGYLLDTSKLHQAMQALELTWPTVSENFAGVLTVESSQDLKNWELLVSDAPLASLQYDGHSLLQNRIDFSPTQAKYLRLSWPNSQTALKLTGIKVELATKQLTTPLHWIKIRGAATNQAGEYVFDLGAHVPMQRIRFDLPQNNTLVNVTLLSRASNEDIWRPVNTALLYKLQRNNQPLNNPDLIVTSHDRYWLLRVDQGSGGLGSGLPDMHIGWLPQQLVFVARGETPFKIAYGNNGLHPAEFDMQPFMLMSNDIEHGLHTAQTGAVVSLGGNKRLEPVPPGLPWKKGLLWLSLSLAVMVLGWMAYRLIKQMNMADTSGDNTKTE